MSYYAGCPSQRSLDRVLSILCSLLLRSIIEFSSWNCGDNRNPRAAGTMDLTNENDRHASSMNSMPDNLVQRSLIICATLILLLTFKLTVSMKTRGEVVSLHDESTPCQNLNSSFSLISDVKPLMSRELFPERPAETCVSRIVENNRELVYIPSAKVLFATMAKSGTTTLFHWLFKLTVGQGTWPTHCLTYVQDIRSPCWQGLAMSVHNLSLEEQEKVLYSDKKILRIAVQRQPYKRLISSFKSKFTCEHEKYRTDLANRASMVPVLRRRAQLTASNTLCMNITEFADALDNCRRRAISFRNGTRGFEFLRLLDVHIRPQVYCFNEIHYDAIIDVADLSDERVLKPLWSRFEHRHKVSPVAGRRHRSTGGSSLTIPDSAAKNLFSFASLSDTAPLRYLKGAKPSYWELKSWLMVQLP